MANFVSAERFAVDTFNFSSFGNVIFYNLCGEWDSETISVLFSPDITDVH